jgi:PAS domain S-box-containing protein
LDESGISALVVEDDHDMALQLKRILVNRFPADARIAGDLEEARRLMAAEQFDIITLDYMLPDGEGLSLLEQITARDDYTRVIMVTGHGDEETAVRSFHMRASGYVVKDARLPARLSEAVDKAVVELNLKRAEEALRRSEEHFRSLIENAQDIIAVVDTGGTITYASPSVSEVLGYKPESLKRTSFTELAHPDDADEVSRCMAEAGEEPGAEPGELRLRHSDGTWHVFEWKCKGIGDAEGDVIINAVDITRRKQAEESLKAYRDHLEQLVEERTARLRTINEQLEQEVGVRKRAEGELKDRAERLSHFLTVASHELRHPISVVKGYTTMLSNYIERVPPEELYDILVAIDASTDRLTSYVEELLDVSRIEGDRFTIMRASTDPRLVIDSALNEMRARGYVNEFEVVAPEGAYRTELDAEKLTKLLVILVDNAIKFSPDGSPITIEVSREGSEVVFSVMDRGIGIPPDKAGEIFNRFFQVEDVQHHSKPGLGLGLYIAKEIAEAHGGRIWCEPREGGGTAFRFTLS